MLSKIKHYNKIILLFSIILFLPMKLYAFEAIKNIPSRNIYFTGRVSHLNEMQKILNQYNRVYLTGYGGVGKSQLAKEYSYINEQSYDLIWWFDSKSDLKTQYENLLNHLNNSELFKDSLHVDVNNIAPSVVIEFTHSLLLERNCKWLLIFDNISGDIKLPNAKIKWQHTIITTREQKVSGNNVLTVGAFTDQESEMFLSKVHPKEKKEEIAKLSKALDNYPLALAQVSQEILMYKKGIDSYLEKHNKLYSKSLPIHSDITQEYKNNYQEVLNLTLQNIENKDSESAKVLYMLALLNVDITKELLKDLFGDGIEEKLMLLSKYGVIQTNTYGHLQVLNIHDVIRNEAIKRLDSNDRVYKKEIIYSLIKYFNSFYSEKNLQYLNNLKAANNHVEVLYAFIDMVLQNNIINDEVINTVIISLKLNNILFNRYANYILYQQLANKIYNKDLSSITAIKKALLYANLIFSDLIFESEASISSFETELLRLVPLVENHKNYGEIFFIYTRCLSFI